MFQRLFCAFCTWEHAVAAAGWDGRIHDGTDGKCGEVGGSDKAEGHDETSFIPLASSTYDGAQGRVRLFHTESS